MTKTFVFWKCKIKSIALEFEIKHNVLKYALKLQVNINEVLFIEYRELQEMFICTDLVANIYCVRAVHSVKIASQIMFDLVRSRVKAITGEFCKIIIFQESLRGILTKLDWGEKNS